MLINNIPKLLKKKSLYHVENQLMIYLSDVLKAQEIQRYLMVCDLISNHVDAVEIWLPDGA